MMLREFLVVLLVVAAPFAGASHEADHEDDYGCCSAEDRREIQYVWQKVWSSAFTDRKVIIARAIFHEVFERYPEARDLFQRVKIDEPDSPEYRSHLVRVANGLDTIINLMDDPDVLLKQIEHLTNQHIARPGVKGDHIKAMVGAFENVLPQVAPCFNVEAWNRCFSKVTHMIAEKLP